MKTWKAKLQNNYSSFAEWESYSQTYGLAARLGFADEQSAWEANPMIQGSTNPADFKLVKSLKLTGAKTRLERHVQAWINRRAADYDTGAAGVLKDLAYGGCSSGMVNHLIYTVDCVKFYKTHRREISALLKELMDSMGEHDLSKIFSNTKSMTWDAEDPLAQEDGNRNILAWFGFEETAQHLATSNGIEV